MTRSGERLASWFAEVLSEAEREAVLGDLAEANVRDGAAMGQIAGLVLRRQLALWKGWQPWLALVGVVGASGFLLDRMALANSWSVAQDWSTWVRYGSHYENGLTEDQNAFVTVSQWIAVASWSWASGLLAGTVARKTSWVAMLVVVLYGVWFIAPTIYLAGRSFADYRAFVLFPAAMQVCVFLLPMLAGVHRGKLAGVGWASAIFLGAWIAIVVAVMTWSSGWWQEAMVRWSEGAWHPGEPWQRRLLPYLFLGWPAVYLIALAARERKQGRLYL